MSEYAQRRFRRSIEDMLESWLWELNNHIENRIADPVDYVEMRRATFGSDLTMALGQLKLGEGLSPDIWRTRTMSGLQNSAQDYCCLMNDIFSYQKEMQFEGELNNAVLVVQKFLECDKDQAVTLVNRLMTARAEQFQHMVKTELPVLIHDLDLDEAAQKKLASYVAGMQDWMASVLNWHAETRRYPEDSLRRSPTMGAVLYGHTSRGSGGLRIQPSAPQAPATPAERSGVPGPSGLGTAGIRIQPSSPPDTAPHDAPPAAAAKGLPGLSGLGTASARIQPPSPHSLPPVVEPQAEAPARIGSAKSASFLEQMKVWRDRA